MLMENAVLISRPDDGADFDGEWPDAPLTAARHVAGIARQRVPDGDGSFPAGDVALLARTGLLHAPFPPAMGGTGLGIGENAAELRDVLTALGRGSLALGRLYEGHVNAVVLVRRYGSTANLNLLLSEARAGRLSGVWMAGPPLRLDRSGSRPVLQGHKVLASGSGFVRRPLVAADDNDGSLMLIPDVDGGRVDASGWTAHGMRATATGTVSFSGLAVAADEIVGRAGDYLKPPFFRGGAWRVIAVQLGGLLGLLDEYREQLGASPHREHPLQLARFGEALIAVETARLWVRQACAMAEGSWVKGIRTEGAGADPATVDAYVDLARNAFEAAALQVIPLAQKALGLKCFLRPNPLERIIRDLSTYLRQPALDVSLMSAAAFHLQGGRAS